MLKTKKNVTTKTGVNVPYRAGVTGVTNFSSIGPRLVLGLGSRIVRVRIAVVQLYADGRTIYRHWANTFLYYVNLTFRQQPLPFPDSGSVRL